MRINDFYNILELIKQDVLHSEAEYLKLLKVVGNNQRYDFRSQLSIYDRNPEATACAKFDYWRERFNRTVMRGQKGIPILEDYGTYKKVDYIFDISQTVSRNRDVNEVNLWRFDKEAHQDVLKEMIKSEGYEESESILENIFSLSRLYGDEKIDSLMNELGISTNLCELEKNKLNFSRKAMEEFLGNGFINNDYNGKVSFQCQPRAYEPNLMNIIINIKDIGETIIVWGSIFNAIGKFVKKCKGYEASINILYFKNKIEKCYI